MTQNQKHSRPSRAPRGRAPGMMSPSKDVLALLSGGARKPQAQPKPRPEPQDTTATSTEEIIATTPLTAAESTEPPVPAPMLEVAEVVEGLPAEAPAEALVVAAVDAPAVAESLAEPVAPASAREAVADDMATQVARPLPAEAAPPAGEWRNELKNVAKEMTRAANFVTSALQQNRTIDEIRGATGKLNERARALLGSLPDDLTPERLMSERISPLQKASGALMRAADKATSLEDALAQALAKPATANNAYLVGALRAAIAGSSSDIGIAPAERLIAEEPSSVPLESIAPPAEAVQLPVATTQPDATPVQRPEPEKVKTVPELAPIGATEAEDLLQAPPARVERVEERRPTTAVTSREREEDLEEFLVAPVPSRTAETTVTDEPATAQTRPSGAHGGKRGAADNRPSAADEIADVMQSAPALAVALEPASAEDLLQSPPAAERTAPAPLSGLKPAPEAEREPPAAELRPLLTVFEEHMGYRGYDAKVLALSSVVVEAIEENGRFRPRGQTVLVLHRSSESVLTATTERSLPAVCSEGDTVLDAPALEYLAPRGVNLSTIGQVRNAVPAATASSTDLEIASRLGAGFLRRADAEGVPVDLFRELRDISVEAQRQMTEQTNKVEAQEFALEQVIKYWGAQSMPEAEVLRLAPSDAAQIQEVRAGRAPAARTVEAEKPLTGLLRKQR